MSTETDHILIGAYWHDRKVSAGRFINACFEFLMELKAISPVFGERCMDVKDRFEMVPNDFDSFQQLMIERLDDPDYAYINPDSADRSFTLESTLLQGFVASFSDPDPNATDENAISIRAMAGAYGAAASAGSALIDLPPAHLNMLEDSQTSRRLLDVLIEVWKPEFASMYSRNLIRLLDPFRKKRPCGVWMYFADSAAASAVCDAASIESTETNGIIIHINVLMPWTETIDVIRPCCERLSAAGFLDRAT